MPISDRLSRMFVLAGVLAASIAIAPIARADEPAEAEPTGDLKTLQGEWKGEGPDGGPLRFSIKGRELTALLGDLRFVTRLTIDDRAEPHPTIDLAILAGSSEMAGAISRGIYAIAEDGETFTLAAAIPGLPRPTDLQEVEGDTYVMELTRVRPGAPSGDRPGRSPKKAPSPPLPTGR